MTDSHARVPATEPATHTPPPLRPKGTPTVGGHHEPIEIETADDACFQGVLSLWTRAGEVAWLRLTLESCDAECPCRAVLCQRRSPRAGPAQPQSVWTLKPFEEPHPA